jgi:hypothetical protein
LVRMRGLEPPRCHHHRLLRPARLPVPPHPQGTGCHYANGFRRCQPRKSCVARGLLPGFVDTRAHWCRKTQRALNTEGKEGERSCSCVLSLFRTGVDRSHDCAEFCVVRSDRRRGRGAVFVRTDHRLDRGANVQRCVPTRSRRGRGVDHVHPSGHHVRRGN